MSLPGAALDLDFSMLLADGLRDAYGIQSVGTVTLTMEFENQEGEKIGDPDLKIRKVRRSAILLRLQWRIRMLYRSSAKREKKCIIPIVFG